MSADLLYCIILDGQMSANLLYCIILDGQMSADSPQREQWGSLAGPWAAWTDMENFENLDPKNYTKE